MSFYWVQYGTQYVYIYWGYNKSTTAYNGKHKPGNHHPHYQESHKSLAGKKSTRTDMSGTIGACNNVMANTGSSFCSPGILLRSCGHIPDNAMILGGTETFFLSNYTV